jgi:hypothetical protein
MSPFNILPGSGLGFTGSKQIAFGLGAMSITEIVPPVVQPGGGGGYYCTVTDNPYAKRNDDDAEIVAILTIILGVIEI